MKTFHILGNPTNPVSIKNRIDPFSIAIVKFIQNMTKLGWNCIHYGTVGCEVDCESVICLDHVSNDRTSDVAKFNIKAGEEIAKRKHKGDFILCFHGWENRGAAQANSDLVTVEPSIGYDTKAVWADFRIFVSYAQMHMFYGERGMLMTPSWYDAVIPNAFSPSEFKFNPNKDNYLLYFGRVIENKGVHIAIQAAERTGHKLIIAGPGDISHLGYSSTPPHVTCVGLCNADQRRELMKNAKAILGPTYYVEPFGNMVVEGYFSGTPAITTDWGGFTETVINGVTGYRCREMRDFTNAINNISSINPHDCLKWATENYSEEIIHQKFDEYFKRLGQGDFYRL